MSTADEERALLDARRPARTRASRCALAGVLAGALGVATWAARTPAGARATPALGAVVSSTDAETIWTATQSLQCAWVCASSDASIAATLAKENPTCAEARALERSACFASTCGCVERTTYADRISRLCDAVPGVVTEPSGEDKVRAACPREYAAATAVDETTEGRAAVAAAAALGVVAPGSVAKLGEENVWEPAFPNGKLLPDPPSVDERAGAKPTTTFKLYTQCKPDHVKTGGGDFWFKPLTAAYLIRHNYGSHAFFLGPKHAGTSHGPLRMQRAELEDGVYGYTLTTNAVDWEYGFLLENAAGETYQDIGEVGQCPLSKESCARRYGDYFNRVLTDEKNPTSVSYVIGNCTRSCENYRDSAWCASDFSGVVGDTPASAIDLGRVDDARLVNFASGLMYGSTTVIDPSGRAETFRYDAGSKNEQLWVIATIDYFRTEVKMAQIKVTRDPETEMAKAYIVGRRKYILGKNKGYAYEEWYKSYKGNGCKKTYCNVARYDISKFWDNGSTASGFNVQRMEFTKMALGDAPPTAYNKQFSADGEIFLQGTPTQILAPGEWGEDMDVRRVVLKNAVLCGGAINYENCMFGKAFPVDVKKFPASLKGSYNGPSKTEKQWFFVIIEDRYFKMVRVSITLGEDQGVYARTVDAGYVEHFRTSDVLTSDSMASDASAKFAQKSHMPVSPGYHGGGYGVGAFKFDLAAEMSVSLRDVSCA